MKSFLIIGADNLGTLIAKHLRDLGHQTMAVDRDEERINNIMPFVTDAQIGDSTNELFLRSLEIDSYDACFVTISEDFQSSLETASLLKELGAKLVVSRADRDVQAKFLLRNGADEVINPEKQIAEWAAITYASTHILDYVKLDDEHAIYEVTVPKDWVGKTVGQIDIRKKYGVTILAVKENGRMILSVNPDTMLTSTRTMLVLGERRDLKKCFRI